MNKLIIDNDILFDKVTQLLTEGKSVTIPVKGYSMLPFIRGERDLVVLKGVRDQSELAVGDIVLFRYAGRYILHRIIGISNGIYEIRGDGIPESAEHCRFADVSGKVTEILRNGTKVIDPYSPFQKVCSRLWQILRPFRVYLLAIYKRLPGNRWIRRQQLVEAGRLNRR